MKFKSINYVENINDDLLFYLDLNKNDLENINKGLANCEKGFLLHEEDDDIVPFENLTFWIDYSIDLLNCKTVSFGKGKISSINLELVTEITRSLEKLKHQCPKNLFWERQFAKKWL